MTAAERIALPPKRAQSVAAAAALWRSTIAAGAVSPGAVLEFLAPLLDAAPRPDDEPSA